MKDRVDGQKWWFHLVGGGIAVAGILFVSLELYSYADELDLSRLGVQKLAILLLLCAVYGGANLLLARAWWRLLRLFRVEVDFEWAVSVYGRSQLAKYVPGNIFHLAGRQALGMAAGASGIPLAKATFWELALISVAGMTFAVLALPLMWEALSVLYVTPVFALVCLGFAAGSGWVLGRESMEAAGWYLLFLCVSALVFVGTLWVIAEPGSGSLPWFAIGGAYVLAWLAGLLTPGAPAGVGIREAALLLLLAESVAPADVVLAVLLVRMVTVIGDVLFFAGATFAQPRVNSKRLARCCQEGNKTPD